MNKLIHFISFAGAMVLCAGCGDRKEGRVEIAPPIADLTFDEALVKKRDIHFNMPEDVVLGTIGPMMVNSKGDLIVLDPSQNTIFQTDAEGHYLRQIGVRGGAEGEYFYVLKLMLDPNDDLYIHSAGEGGMKYLVFSGGSYRFKREFADPNFSSGGLVDHIIFTDGGHIYASQVDVIDGGTSGVRVDGEYALFRLDDHFNKVGGMYPVEDTRTGRALNRYKNTILTPKREGGFYFMYPTAYEIHQYSEKGELEQTLFSVYRSKHRDSIKPFPAALEPTDWNPQIETWFAEHILPVQLFEYGSDLIVLEQNRREVGGAWKGYLNILYKDGHSVADGISVPAKHSLLTVAGTELYFAVEGAFDKATGETSDPYVAVYQLNDRVGEAR